MENNTLNKDDFKFVLQDTNRLYFGRELSYQEMMDREDVPFKWKAIIGTYISKDAELLLKMSEHIVDIDKSTFSYKIFEQLKLEIKYFYKDEAKNIFGKTKIKYVHTSCKISDIDKIREKLKNGEYTIEEISISKLALMVISI